MKLSADDRQSRIWRQINAYCEGRIAVLHIEGETPAPLETTRLQQGQIQAYRDIIAIGAAEPVAMVEHEESFGIKAGG